MPFILLGRAEDGQLTLLSTEAWPKRSDALSELSRLTGDPAFDRWDDEVFVIDVDIDAGTPVLLVRPASASASADETDEAASPVEEPSAEPAPEVEEEGSSDEEAAPEAPEIAALLDDLSAEAQPGPTAADDAEAAPADESPGTLKEALTRTAAQLEAEGIVAPESVGPAEEAAPVDDDGTAEGMEPAEGVAPAPGAWPWDSSPETSKPAFDLDAIEVPRDDGESLVRAPGDEETMSVARPVILGGDFAAEAPGPPVADVPAEPAPAGAEAAAAQDAAPGEPAAAAPAPALESDFIELGVSEAPADQPGLEPAGVPTTDIRSLACEECVYAETCPNKGQLDPATCGSFQWK